MLTLYDYFRSSACFRVRIALNLKELDYDVIPIHLLKEGGQQYSVDYQAVNPQSLVPALLDNENIITQSIAIIEYLDELYPSFPLLPKDALSRAQVRSFALAIVADIHPLNNLRVLTYLTEQFHITEEQKKQWYRHWIMKGLSALEKKLVMSKASGDFCYGDRPTLADVCLVPQLFNARRFDCDLSAYPLLVKFDNNCQKIAAFSEAFPKEDAT